MLSKKQLNANRNNCLKSTGPRTADGKHTAAQNSFKHGLRSSHIVSRARDNAQFKQFRDELFAQLAPVGLLESHLSDQAASALWKMQRLGQLEPELLDTLQNRYIDNQIADDKQDLTPADRVLEFETLFYSTMTTYPDPAFQLRFDGALNFWLKTPEGKTYKEGRWSILPGSKSYIQCFKEFWAEYYGKPIDPRYYTPKDNPVTLPASPAEPVLSNVEGTQAPDSPSQPEQRTDLAYQVMLESRTAQSNVAESRWTSGPLRENTGVAPSSDRHPESPLRGEGSDRIASRSDSTNNSVILDSIQNSGSLEDANADTRVAPSSDQLVGGSNSPSRSDSSINHSSLINNQLEGSNPEAIASGAGGSDGVEKLASNTGTAAGPAVSDSETGLNPLRDLRVLRGEKLISENLSPRDLRQSVVSNPQNESESSDDIPSLAPAMVEDFSGSNILLKFSRYQTQAERSLYRVLNELTKLQSLRKRNEAILESQAPSVSEGIDVLHNNNKDGLM